MINKVILSLFLSLGMVFPVYAEDEAPVNEAQTAEQVEQPQAQIEQVTENVAQENQKILENTNLSLDKEQKPVFVAEYKIEKNLQSLPNCDDENLQKKAYEYITSYFDSIQNQSALYRRHKYFILNNLDKFAEQNVADYKTAETSPVSDVIAYIKMNKGIIEENMRLCKNTSSNKYAGKVYLLIYPEDENNNTVRVINLSKGPQENTSFLYAK